MNRMYAVPTNAVLLAATMLICGCQCASQQTLPCGESAGCASYSDPLIIFVGADRDVGKWGKVPELTEDFRSWGYNAVYFDPWKQLHDHEVVASWIRTAVKCRGKRVLLVGWSQGAVVGLKALDIVAREGICIDTFVELDSFNTTRYVGDCPQPSNVNRVVVIRSQLNKLTEGYHCPVVHSLDTCWHLSSPTHEHTVRVLRHEANRLQSVGQCLEASVQSPPEADVTLTDDDSSIPTLNVSDSRIVE